MRTKQHKKPKQPTREEQEAFAEQMFADRTEWGHSHGAPARLDILERMSAQAIRNPQSRIWRLNRGRSNYQLGAHR